MNIIEVKDLVKNYPPQSKKGSLVKAVRGISFHVKEGEIFGFLGPNGAGKTTTISILTTMLKSTAGEAKVDGLEVTEDQYRVRQKIGIVFQDPSLDKDLTAYENLKFHAVLYGLEKEVYERRISQGLALVELEEQRNLLVRTFSGGMKRRLEIARGLIHHPELLFLDEPTLGLDPQTRAKIWQYLTKLNKEKGITLFLTTHYMEEAEICDRIAVMDHGKIIALGSPLELKKRLGKEIIYLQTENDQKALEILRKKFGQERVEQSKEGLYLKVNGEKEQISVSKIMKLFDFEVDSIQVKRPSLEDVFLHFTGRKIRE